MTDRLDADRIAEGVLPALRPRLRRVTVLERVDSTSSELGRLPAAERHAHALLAEMQSAGRGRGARRWHSPAVGNVYLSVGWCFRELGTQGSALPLAVAVALSDTLAAAGLREAGIKWPNDILVDGRKLAGILVESQAQAASGVAVIAGIGINVRMTQAETMAEADAAIDRPWTDLESHLPPTRRPIERNELVAGLLSRLIAAFERFERSGFATFRPRYEALDLLAGRRVTLEHASGDVSGTGRGVDENGCLRLELAGGELKTFHFGEVRVFES